MGTTVFERQQPAASTIRQSLMDTRHGVFWLDDLADVPTREPLTGAHTADLAIVGGGYSGLWTAVLAKRRNPAARVVLLEARTVGWAASGRNGGFCEASITHGRENAVSRWPEEAAVLERLGLQNLDAFESDVAEWDIRADFERTGALAVAIEPHELAWLQEQKAEAVAEGDDTIILLDEAQTRAAVGSPTYLGATWDTRGCAMLHPGKMAAELARVAEDLGVEIFEHSLVKNVETPDGAGAVVRTAAGSVTAAQVALGTNVYPSLLGRNRLMTVPVYDYVLMTEPLSDDQLASIGWQDRQGIADMANQFHYYRLTADNRILWGGYDAVYHYGRKVRAQYEERPSTYELLASHFFTTFPQLAGLRFSHRWAGAIDTSTQFCAFYGLARGGRVAYSAGYTGLGVGATRFGAEVMLDLLEGRETERTALEMVRRRPLPFPPEPAAAIGINATRWSLNRADHNAGKRNVLLRTLDALGLGFDS
ncbi:NAD(P)/FAD-dependent oxidoreductase [Microbacterium sp. P01]|uniref:NAD(P)/FAD-dependent oxidoreductase n=1 Tax=Microbacterium sp. P01 TaxID=3366261 RepID=UPI003672969C